MCIRDRSNIDLITYPDAHHSFDSIDPIEFIPYAIRLTEKFAVIDKNSNLTFTLDDGTVIPCDDAEGRTNLIKAVPGIMGAHAGCNWEARRQCHKDVISFFKKEFLNS